MGPVEFHGGKVSRVGALLRNVRFLIAEDNRSVPLLPLDQTLQGIDIPAIIPGLVDWRFRDEGRMPGARMIEQSTECFPANLALANMFVAVELRSALRF